MAFAELCLPSALALLVVGCGGNVTVSTSAPATREVVSWPTELRLWLQVDTLESTLSDGASVASWSDISGQGRHASQSTPSYRPTFRANMANGRGAVEFDGTDDHFSDVMTYTAQTVFAVYRMSSSLQNTTHLAQLWGSYADGVHVAPDPRNPTPGGFSFDGLPGSGTTGRHAINSGILSGSYAALVTTPVWSYNLAQVVTAEFQLVRTVNRQVIGSLAPHFAVGTHQLGGYLFELIVYGKQLTDAERAQIVSYLRGKYSI